MTELCHIRHEADLSEYTGTVVDGGDLSAHADAAMGGTAKGLKLEIDDQTEIYGWKDIGGMPAGAAMDGVDRDVFDAGGGPGIGVIRT